MKAQRKFCPTHGSVLAVKNTHRLRNAVTGVALLGVGSKVEPYMCPICGGPVKDRGALSWQEQVELGKVER